MNGASNQFSQRPPGPLSLVIGITGHRDLGESEQAIGLRVHEIFQKLQHDFPQTPLILLSALAEGADRLVARAALEYAARLIVPLPMKPELYEKDFKTDLSKAEFAKLLKDAEESGGRVFSMPAITSDAEISKPGEARDLQYLLSGVYTARNSQLLIAIWDGKYSGKLGGTSQIIEFKRSGNLPVGDRNRMLLENLPEPYGLPSSAMDLSEIGPVIHVSLERPNDAGALYPKGSGHFGRKDVRDWRSLMDKLREPKEKISADLSTFLSERNQRLLLKHQNSDKPPRLLQRAIVRQLNRFVDDPRTVNPEDISGISIMEETQGLLQQLQRPEGTGAHEHTKRLKRWLLEENYAREVFNSKAKVAYRRIFQNIRNFNADARKPSYCDDEAQKSSGESLLYGKSHPTEDAQEVESFHPSLGQLIKSYTKADTMAIRFQSLTWRTLRGLFVLVGLAALCLGLSHVLQNELRPSFLVLYLALVLVAYLLFLLASFKKYQNKFQDYRALAEGLRIQFFWRLAGLQNSVSDHYLRKQRSELDWICDGVRASGLMSSAESTPRITYIFRQWVQNQTTYFKDAATRDHLKLTSFKYYAYGFLFVGIGAATYLVGAEKHFNASIILTAYSILAIIVHGFIHKKELSKDLEEYGVAFLLERFAVGLVLALIVILAFISIPKIIPGFHSDHATREIMVASLGLPMVIAALIHGYIEKRALSEQHKQYKHMHELFDHARGQLQEMLNNNDLERAHRLILELGKEALAENGDWLLLHRERPLEVPKAG